jgi:hypothetical protein
MLQRILPLWLGLGAVLGAGLLMSAAAGEAAAAEWRTSPDLFYNYYVPPGGCPGVGAALYPAPRPTPVLVGHTYVTYQPLMPHEFLYQHHRTYYRRNPGAGWTKTTVSWGNNLLNPGLILQPPRPQRMTVAGLKWEQFSPWKLR